MPTPLYTLPNDDNGILMDGVIIPNTGITAVGGHYPTTDNNSKTTSAVDMFPVGVKSAIVPTTTTIVTSTDTTVVFASTYHRLMFQNNSAYILYFNFDYAATLMAFSLSPGTLFEFDTQSVLHLFQASGSSMTINGASGIMILAW